MTRRCAVCGGLRLAEYAGRQFIQELADLVFKPRRIEEIENIYKKIDNSNDKGRNGKV